MLETVAAGLILAAVSGLTYIAYKHPKAFRKLLIVLVPLLVASQMILLTWSIAIGIVFVKLYPLIEQSKWAQADATVSTLVPRWWLVGLISLGSWLYLAFLSSLPAWLHNEEESKLDHKRPKEKD